MPSATHGDSFSRMHPSIPVNSPVSFPHLWVSRSVDWFHWDGNTNSFMERNIGQAMGLGAIADPKTGESTILASNIHTIGNLFLSANPPQMARGNNSARWTPPRNGTGECARCT